MRDDTGAESIEFALVAPILLIAVLGAVYALLAAAAQVSLQHATGVAARYAAIPAADGTFDTYPDDAAVLRKLTDSTPFFAPASCTATVTGDQEQNRKLTLAARCTLPNPIGQVLGVAESMTMSTVAEARRE